jgi:hypothetical protein
VLCLGDGILIVATLVESAVVGFWKKWFYPCFVVS